MEPLRPTLRTPPMPDNPAPSLRDLLTLLALPGIGTGRIRRLFGAFPSLDAIRTASIAQLCAVPGIEREHARLLRHCRPTRRVELQLERLALDGFGALTFWSADYPEPLRRIPDPPVLLFVHGNPPRSWERAVAVVGTRRPSAYGRRVAEHLSAELVREGMTVVSGLARGVDTVAHEAALAAGGLTAALLGCGIDVIYPPENRNLFRRIGEHGVLLSEHPPGILPDGPHFPRRNRLISGLCRGVVVVEAGLRSGALITADFALEHNREVFAVPGSLYAPQSAGPHALIQQGAKLVTGVDDILEELTGRLATPTALPTPLPEDLSGEDRALLEHITAEPRHIDHLVLELGASPATLLAQLLRLELRGLVRQMGGKMFVRS